MTTTDGDLVVVGGRDVVIVGGGACDWALSREPVARFDTLVHRRGAFRTHARTAEFVSTGRAA